MLLCFVQCVAHSHTRLTHMARIERRTHMQHYYILCAPCVLFGVLQSPVAKSKVSASKSECVVRRCDTDIKPLANCVEGRRRGVGMRERDVAHRLCLLESSREQKQTMQSGVTKVQMTDFKANAG